MARFEFRLPDIGEGIAEAEIVAWHVKIGDRIDEDQPIADLMTDKATVEIESPVSGTVLEVAGDAGDKIAIGSTLVVIEVEGAALETTEAALPDPQRTPAAPPSALPARSEDDLAVKPTHFIPAPHPDARPIAVPLPTAQALASPAVRARARTLRIDLAQVKAREGGHIRHGDLDAFIAYQAGQGYAPAGATRGDEVVKVIGLRRKIAENMAASKRHIPHFTYVDEIDVTALEAMRGDLNDNRGSRPKLSVLPLLIVAICKVIPQFPMMNARYDDEAGLVTRHGSVHLGMATQTDAGLMVPVIRNAEQLNIWQLAGEIARLAEAARSGKAKIEDLSGSTLTITSLGPLGGLVTTPVINRPEVAIIGPNKIVERAVFDGDDIRRAKVMNLSISCDHRVVDGWDAARFVQAVKHCLETPVLLFAD
jgi:2-oxoisovalerate dehydrogenase E2 component (dihydrolipoyl transacylase)